MQKEDLEYLNQLISSLEESLTKLEIAYEKKEFEKFDNLKKFVLNLFTKISETAK